MMNAQSAGAAASATSNGNGGMTSSTQPAANAAMSSPSTDGPSNSGSAGATSGAGTGATAGAAGATTSPSAAGTSSAEGGAGGAMSGAGMGGAAGSGSAPCVAGPEQCDNTDNDCDGKIDEEVTRPCGTDVGACELGALACHAGQWDDEKTQCMGSRGPAKEECDTAREDENCDGVRNEGCECTDGETQECGNDTAPCKPGSVTCVNGTWPSDAASCKGAVGPKAESCDGVDNDCNGNVDDRAPCSEAGTSCRNGRCVQCTSDSDCSSLDATCKVGVCNTQGRCEARNAADAVACSISSGSGVCQSGQCRECITSNDCRSRSGKPVCSRNECVTCTATEGCGSGQTCSDGQCVARCGNGQVDSDEECDTGAGSGWDLSTCTIDCKRRVYANCSSGVSCTQGQMCGTSLNICTNLFCTGTDSCAKIPGFAVMCTSNSLCEILCNGGRCPNGLRCSATANGVMSCVP
jgi:Putative metal-binding motif